MSQKTAQTPKSKQLAEQVYDMIMGKIDQDLLLENIPNLDAKYAGETEEEKEKRMERYKVSYKKFDQEMEAFMTKVHTRSRKSKQQALREKEQKSRSEEASELQQLELSFDTTL